jgi:hypothetical protein
MATVTATATATATAQYYGVLLLLLLPQGRPALFSAFRASLALLAAESDPSAREFQLFTIPRSSETRPVAR